MDRNKRNKIKGQVAKKEMGRRIRGGQRSPKISKFKILSGEEVKRGILKYEIGEKKSSKAMEVGGFETLKSGLIVKEDTWFLVFC